MAGLSGDDALALAKKYIKKSMSGTGAIKGEKGEKGEPGATGATFTPNVSNNGVLSWTNDGGLDNPNPINIKGAKGETGKSAYEYAKAGGYAGTEEDFKKVLAKPMTEDRVNNAINNYFVNDKEELNTKINELINERL